MIRNNYTLAVVLCCLSFWVSIVFNLDPSQRLERQLAGAAGRYLPILLMFGALVAFVVAGIPKRTFQNKAFLFGLVFFLYMFIGGLIGLDQRGELEETFLGRSLGMIAFFTGLAFAQKPEILNEVTKRITGPLIVAGFLGVALIGMRSANIAFTQYQHILRVEQTFFVAAIALFCMGASKGYLRILLFFVFAAISIFTGKSTMMLLGILFLAFTFGSDILAYIRAASRRSASFKGIRNVIVFATLIALSLMAFATFSVVFERLTRYEFDLRLVMWVSLYEQFWEAPLLGSYFTASPIFAFARLEDLSLSTHNDFIDVLVYGGVIAAVPLLYLLVSVFRFNPILQLQDVQSSGRLLYLLLVSFYLMSAIGNPFYSTPSLAIVVWFSIGVLAARPVPRMSDAALQAHPFYRPLALQREA